MSLADARLVLERRLHRHRKSQQLRFYPDFTEKIATSVPELLHMARFLWQTVMHNVSN
jgi:hypothetical protein